MFEGTTVYLIALFLTLFSIIIQLSNFETKLNERLDNLEKKIDGNAGELYKEIKNCEIVNKCEFDDLKNKLGKAFNLMYTEIELLNSNNKDAKPEQPNN